METVCHVDLLDKLSRVYNLGKASLSTADRVEKDGRKRYIVTVRFENCIETFSGWSFNCINEAQTFAIKRAYNHFIDGGYREHSPNIPVHRLGHTVYEWTLQMSNGIAICNHIIQAVMEENFQLRQKLTIQEQERQKLLRMLAMKDTEKDSILN